MAVLSTFRALSLCRQVHGELMRSTLLDLTPIISATVCHQSNYIERYSRYIIRSEKVRDPLAPLPLRRTFLREGLRAFLGVPAEEQLIVDAHGERGSC